MSPVAGSMATIIDRPAMVSFPQAYMREVVRTGLYEEATGSVMTCEPSATL
jgi:hypothetical protein